MAVRTNDAAVKGILGVNYDTKRNPSLSPFIASATALVDRLVACAEEQDYAFVASELELIEMWLSAHFYAAMDQTLSSKSTQGASGGYHGQTGMYLEGTKYGQAAVTLDYSGCLAAITSGAVPVPSLEWVGKRPSEQLSYHERS